MVFHMIAPDEMSTYIYDRNCLIIDLREKEEYRKRHIKNAVNVPYRTWNRYENSEAFQKMCRTKKIILYCERGPTSFSVAKELAEKGITVSVMVGGMKAYRGKIEDRY